MRKLSRYLRICFKRIRKAYPQILCVTLLLFLCVLAISAMILKKYSGSEYKQKIEVGVVDYSEDENIDIGLLALDKIDNLKFSVTFTEMDEKTAKRTLMSDEIIGYVKIPKGYLHNIFHGKNMPATYVTKRSSSGFNRAVAEKLTKTISDVVTNSQSLIFAAYDIDEELNRPEIYDDNEKINAIFLESLMHRDDIFTEKILGVKDSISMMGYYICGMLTFFMFLLGISFCKVLYKKEYSLNRVLKRTGIGPIKQILSEYLAFFVFMFITIAIFTFIEFKVFEAKEIAEAGAFDSYLTCQFIIAIIPVVMAISAFQLMLYESANGIISAVILQFVVTALFAYLSGLFYPSYFFPEGAARIGEVLPSGAAFSYIRKCMVFENEAGDTVLLYFYTLLFLTATVLIREFKIRRDSL